MIDLILHILLFIEINIIILGVVLTAIKSRNKPPQTLNRKEMINYAKRKK